MIKYIIKRILAMVLILFIITSLTFIFIRMIPGSIVPVGTDKEVEQALIEKYHLDEPLIDQYIIFIKNYATLDFGESIVVAPNREAFDIIGERLPISLQINVFALILTLPVGIFLGIIAALKKNTFTDKSITFGVILFISVPSFIFATLLQYYLSYELGWFPLHVEPGPLTASKFYSMILPIFALSFGGIATITRYMRAELFEALNSDYMLLAKAKGLSQMQATTRHAIRNSFVPLCNIVVPMFLGLLSGSLVIEKLFLINGIGGLTVSAIGASDYFLASATLFFYSIITLVAILLIDISYGLVDPRIRIGGGRRNG